jgi:hypothetical protein
MNPSPYPAPTYTAPFTSAHTRASIVKILLIVDAIASGLLLLSEGLSLAVPPLNDNQEIGDNPAGLAIALVMFLLAIVNIILYLATVIFFCVWLYRAYDNLPALGNPTRALSYSPGWAVGSFFVPIVNLFVPYRAIKELWQKSVLPEERLMSEPDVPAWFHIWWLFWLLSSFAGNISMRASFNENISTETSTIISVVAGALSIIAAVLAYLVVSEIDNRQEETSRALRLGKFSGPPPAPFNMPMQDQVTPQ